MYNIQIDQNSTIFDALLRLNEVDNNKLLFVIDKDNKVVGTLSDGDIRRSLVVDQDLKKKIYTICNNKFSYIVESDQSFDLSKYKLKGIKFLPVLNQNLNLVNVIDLNISDYILSLDCVIMAGGRGKRLSPLTDKIPKPLLKINHKPIINYVIDNILKYGINNISITVNYLSKMIIDEMNKSYNNEINISYVKETKFLGTAGSLSLIDNFSSDYVLVTNGDAISNLNIAKMYFDMIDQKADVIIASNTYSVDIPYGVIDYRQDSREVVNFKEKPLLNFFTNSGYYIFRKDLFNFIKKDTYVDMNTFLEDLLKRNYKIVHYPIKGYWIDIGNPTDYKNAKNFFKR
tara:strand:- start:4286 stop:5317 length:1032 start_codon:yes stop_codon:yes gene_type:complete